MKTFTDPNALMLCHDCLITGYVPNLVFKDGTTANANTGMWMHYIGLSNLNRTDAACEDFPERIIATGNEREAVGSDPWRVGTPISTCSLVTNSVQFYAGF
jgi:hypothetical protein